MLRKILIVLGALTFALFIFFNFILEGIVKNKLHSLLEDTFGSYYQISFDTNYTSLSLSGFSIGFDGVNLRTDTTNKFMMSKYAPVFFTANRLEFSDISVSNLLFKSDIDVGAFELAEPNLLFLIGSKKTEKATSEDERSANENPIKQVEIEAFKLSGGSAAFVFLKNKADTLYAGKDLNVDFEKLDVKFDLDGISPENVTVSQVLINLDDVVYNRETSPYKYQMSNMQMNYQQGELTCLEVDLIPKHSLVEMTLGKAYQKTMFDIKIGQFSLNEIQFDSLKNQGVLRASNGVLKDAEFTLLRNANFPLDPSNKVLMHESLAKSTFPIDLDTLFIQNAKIDYELIPKGKSEPGQVLLTEINGHLAKLYSEDRKKDTLHLELSSKFMEHGALSFAADFPLNGIPGHNYKGHISHLPFTDLNSIVTPMVNVQLNEGIIDDIYFTGVCTDRLTTGEMIFDYDNLKLQFNNEKKGKRNWLISDVGNLIVRHKSKKDKDGRSRAVNYSYERPLYQGHIGFYLNGLLDGMMKNLLPTPVYKVAIKGMTPKTD